MLQISIFKRFCEIWKSDDQNEIDIYYDSLEDYNGVILYQAASENKLEIANYVLERREFYPHIYTSVFLVCCRKGHHTIMDKLLLTGKVDINYSAFYFACTHNQVETLKKLHEITPIMPYLRKLFDDSIRHNVLDVCKYLLSFNHDLDMFKFFVMVCERDNIEMAKIFVDYKVDIHESDDLVFTRVCRKGYIDMLYFLLDLTTKWKVPHGIINPQVKEILKRHGLIFSYEINKEKSIVLSTVKLCPDTERIVSSYIIRTN